jgi:small subunit ribosomal protein S20
MPGGGQTKIKKRKKSVLKRAQQSRERADVNRANRTRVRTLMRRLRTAITAKDATAAGNLLHPTMSAIDRAITKGVLHENTGNRYKSRLTLAFNQVKAAKA